MVIVLSSIVVDSIDSIPGTVKKNRLCKFSAIRASFQEKSKYFLAWDQDHVTVQCHMSPFRTLWKSNSAFLYFRNTQLMSFSIFGVTVLVYVVRYFDILLFYFFFVGIVIYCTVASIWCFYIYKLYFSIIRRYSKYNLI